MLVLLMCIFASSCSRDEAPEGMQLASCEGEPFKLYVPVDWTPNTASGISGAYYTVDEKVIITARYYTPADSEMTLDGYIEYCADSYAASCDGFSITGRYSDVLAGEDARRLVYVMVTDGVEYTCTQLSAKYNGDMVSLALYVPTSKAESYSETWTEIVENFILCEKPETVNDEVTDKKTPEGMKIASSDDIEYRLYVPKSWICSSESGKSEAYYPESGKTNVTVTSYSSDGDIALGDYWKMCSESYAESISGYRLLEEGMTSVASRDAKDVTFAAEYDGVEYTLRQVIIDRNGLFYTITYTALTENFSLHSEDFQSMLDAFIFR